MLKEKYNEQVGKLLEQITIFQKNSQCHLGVDVKWMETRVRYYLTSALGESVTNTGRGTKAHSVNLSIYCIKLYGII